MTNTLVIVFFCLGIFGLIHQHITTGIWFTFGHFWHHEPLIACCFTAGTEATLTGETIDGTSIEGKDTVNIVPKGKK